MRLITLFRSGAPRIGALALLVVVDSCTSTPAPSLRVAASGDYRPFSIATNYGEMSGFESAIAHRFAHDSGRAVTFVPLRWPQLIEDARAGRFDVAMSGVTMRPDRTLDMLFSRPYAVTGAVVIVRRDRVGELGTLEGIDRRGVRLAVNRGGHLERVSRARFRQAAIVAVDDNTKLADLVLAGEVDAVVSEEYEAAGWPRETLVVLGPFTRDRKAYAVVSGRADLLDELNDWLAARESDGWLNDERRRWLGERAVWTYERACFEAIAAAIDMRLQLMPWVAAAKRQRGLPIEDPQQEERVLAQAQQWAEGAALHKEGVTDVFARLIAVGKAIQLQAPKTDGFPTELETLRRAVAVQSRWLVDELGRCSPVLSRPEWRAAVANALNDALSSEVKKYVSATELAGLLTRIRPIAPPAESAGGFVEFCIPPQLRFERQGYAAEELINGVPRKASLLERLGGETRIDLHAGATRVAVSPEHHEFRIYVIGSSGDPHLVGGPSTSPTRVEVDVPHNQVVTIVLVPTIRSDGRFELRWQEVYGVALGILQPYQGVVRFDVEIQIYEPNSPGSPSRCPWTSQ